MTSSTYLLQLRLRWVAAGAFAALASAVFLQHELGWLPCALCSLQRVAFVIVLAGALAGAFGSRTLTVAGRAVASFGALAGLVFAGQHLWLLWGPPATTCGDGLRHFVDRMVEALPGSDWLLAGVVPCDDASNLLLGLPLAAWAAGLFVVTLGALWQRPRR